MLNQKDLKKALLILIVCSIFCCLFIFAKIRKNNEPKGVVQNINYKESKEKILNPDQGFYRTAVVGITPTNVEDKTYIIRDEFQIYHLRMDISSFSGVVNGKHDILLTELALNGINDLIKTFYQKGKNVIIRFSYDKDFKGLANQEPSEEIIVEHIKQLSSVLNLYPLTITAIEVGMVGPWGEMHSSQLANSQTISKLISAFLDNVKDIPILVRTPKMIYDYLGITINDLDNYTINKDSKAYRLGLFNDGYLSSNSDLGTYTNREKEIKWISKQTSHLPFGGEVSKPNSSLNDIDNCTHEMFEINLSYLNYEWNDKIVQGKWQEQIYRGKDSLYKGETAYKYIENHLGYRLVLEKSTFYYSKKKKELKINLEVNNVGFANLNREKNLVLYFIKNNEIAKSIDAGSYKADGNINIECFGKLAKGEYEVYLGINNMCENNYCYEISFANEDIWKENLKANKIGYLII